MKGDFANARVAALVRSAGAHRVSAEAIGALNEILTERGLKIARYAVEIARHNGRKTVQENDVKLAAQR